MIRARIKPAWPIIVQGTGGIEVDYDSAGRATVGFDYESSALGTDLSDAVTAAATSATAAAASQTAAATSATNAATSATAAATSATDAAASAASVNFPGAFFETIDDAVAENLTGIPSVRILRYTADSAAAVGDYVFVGAEPTEHDSYFEDDAGNFFELQSPIVQLEHFDDFNLATGIFNVDAKTAFDRAVLYSASKSAKIIVNRVFKCTTEPAKINGVIHFEFLGGGSIYRDYDASDSTRGLFAFDNSTGNSSGSKIINASVRSTDRGATASGSALSIIAAGNAFSIGEYEIENFRASNDGTDDWGDCTVVFDGSLKTTGAVGLRHMRFSGQLFGGPNGAIRVKSCKYSHFTRLQLNTTGGTSAKLIVGGTAGVISESLEVSGTTFADIELDRLANAVFTCANVAGSITNTANVSAVRGTGVVSGTKQTNWINSDWDG